VLERKNVQDRPKTMSQWGMEGKWCLTDKMPPRDAHDIPVELPDPWEVSQKSATQMSRSDFREPVFAEPPRTSLLRPGPVMPKDVRAPNFQTCCRDQGLRVARIAFAPPHPALHLLAIDTTKVGHNLVHTVYNAEGRAPYLHCGH
jgi:hypothetical protein